jgi:hypothetical protein
MRCFKSSIRNIQERSHGDLGLEYIGKDISQWEKVSNKKESYAND